MIHSPSTLDSLFYPCCGTDIQEPLIRFHDEVSHFWFVDDSMKSDSLQALAHATELVMAHDQYTLTETNNRSLLGRTIRKREPYRVNVHTQSYRSRSGERDLHVHFCEGRGYDAFRAVFDDLSHRLAVFFYRGDSQGEGGSGFYWLGDEIFPHILKRLNPIALIVTDGSNTRHPTRHKMSVHHAMRNANSARCAAESPPFEYLSKGDRMLYRFECTGHLGSRYGPTLIWKSERVEKPS